MSEKYKIGFDRTKEVAVIETSEMRIELNEEEYKGMIRELTEVCGTGWAIIHRIERERKLKEYIRDHPGCRYIEIMNDIGDPRNHMGYMSVTCSLTNMVDKGMIVVSLDEQGKRMYSISGGLV